MAPTGQRGGLRVAALTTLAMFAFAANSLLCRAALGESAIDAASFATVRFGSGALTLLLIQAIRRRGRLGTLAGSLSAAAILLLYAVPFSFAYVRLATGTGALILFGAAQATMLISALASGERPHPMQWLGLTTALAGLVYLAQPGLDAPDSLGAGLMAIAGVGWGLYSLRGRGPGDPLGSRSST